MYILKKTHGEKFIISNFLLGTRDQECFNHNINTSFSKNPFFYDFHVHKNYIKHNKKHAYNNIPKKLKKRVGL